MVSMLNSKHRLGLFSLVMIAVVSVDSLRNLPIGAQYGFSLISFYLIAGLTFFFPLAWVSARLVTLYPNTGGSYVWINAAFGRSFGYLSIWLQWIYNMIWYPTIFAFINATLASLIHPGLENNTWFILLSSLAAFWMLSLIHCFGIRTTKWMSAFGAIVGTLLPMLLLILLSVYWLLSGSPSATPFSWSALLPDAHSMKNLAFFSNILFSLLGLEVIAMHAGNVVEPAKTYPKALAFSAVLILFTLMFSSLALCIILPAEKIALISGLMAVYQIFFTTYHLPFGANLIGACIVIGGLAITSSWMIGLARGLQVALAANEAPLWMRTLNKNGMPARVLFLQAIIYSFLLSIFLFLPNINQSYWVLSALSAQFAILYYILLFCAAIKLLRQKNQTFFNRLLSLVLPTIACVICLIGIVVGFLPPEDIQATNTLRYELLMVLGFIVIAFFPVLVLRRRK